MFTTFVYLIIFKNHLFDLITQTIARIFNLSKNNLFKNYVRIFFSSSINYSKLFTTSSQPFLSRLNFHNNKYTQFLIAQFQYSIYQMYIEIYLGNMEKKTGNQRGKRTRSRVNCAPAIVLQPFQRSGSVHTVANVRLDALSARNSAEVVMVLLLVVGWIEWSGARSNRKRAAQVRGGFNSLEISNRVSLPGIGKCFKRVCTNSA